MTPATSTARRPICCAHRSHSYYVRDGRRVAAPFDFDTGITVSNGGLNAPLDRHGEICRLPASAIRRARRTMTWCCRRSSLEEMWRPQIAAGDDFTQGRMARTTQSGLSFFIDAAGPVRFVGHNGDQNGFRAYLSLCPDQRAGSLLAFNTEDRAACGTTPPTALRPRSPHRPGDRTACARRWRAERLPTRQGLKDGARRRPARRRGAAEQHRLHLARDPGRVEVAIMRRAGIVRLAGRLSISELSQAPTSITCR